MKFRLSRRAYLALIGLAVLLTWLATFPLSLWLQGHTW